MLLHYSIRVIGRVQGVFFRASAQRKALDLGLTGWVRNEEEGSVSAEVEGAKENLAAFLDWCRRGPPHARVEKVASQPGPVVGYKGFTVR